MKNFTNNFKQFTSRLSARWLIMALMLLVGTSSAWAWDINSGTTIYFDAGSWNVNKKLQIMYGHSTYSECKVMTHVQGTIYSYKFSSTWGGVTQIAFFVNDQWGTENSSVANRIGYAGDTKTGVYYLSNTSGHGTLSGNVGFNTSLSRTNNYTLPAITYSITYNANGGTGTIASQTKTKGTAITLSDGSGFSKTGYTLDSWNTNSAGTGTKYKLSASYTTDAALALYAKWTANQYTITYKDQGGAAFSGTHAAGAPTTHTYGAKTTLKDPTKSGYNFLGWFTKSDCSGTAVASLGATAYTANITLYARWEKICVPETSITSAELQPNGTISLVGNFTTCGAKYHGFQWRKVGSNWCGETGYANNKESNYVTIGNTDVNGSETASFTPEDGVTYEFRTYIVTTSPWLYSTTTKEVSTCTPANVQISNLSSTTLCEGGSLTFDYTAAAGAKVTFKMGTNPERFTVTGDGSNSGTVTIKYNSDTSINNVIKYDVSGTGICALTGQSTGKTIKCGPVPSIAATSGTSFSFCPGDAAVTLSVTSGKGTYSWAKDGEVIAGKTTYSIEVDQAGIYTVFVVGTGGCESNTITFTVNGNGGPVIKSTDADFNKNNFADFAALYVTDCSGKEITGYQWYKDGVEYVSKCEYTTKDGAVTGDAGQTNNIRPKAAGNYTCKATYKDGTSATSAAFEVTATSGTVYTDFQSNLPVIMVNTGSTNFPSCPVANETASKHAEEMKEKLSVDVRILSDGKIVYDRKARMAYRGSSSLNFLKKSYAFCPGDANCGDAKKGADYVKTAKLNMLGIGDACDKDWVLYAAAADPSMLRNRMVFETYQAMRPGEWGVKSRYVELIINGEYKGVYLMMDKITQNEKRVNVEWSVKDETKRGFILKFDKTDVVDRSKDYPDGDEKTFLSKYSGKHDIGTYDATNDQAFEIEYPEKGDIEDEGGNWYDVINFIQGMINNFETALSAGEYQKVQQIIDYESWADWFILSEYTKNVDAFRASCVFVYDGTKLKATPLWDQELSFNNQSVHANRYKDDPNNKGCENVNGLLIKNDRVYSDSFAAPFWFTGKLAAGKGTEKLAAKTFTGALLNDPCFVQMVKNRWKAHKDGALSNASLTALITNYEKELTSAVRDREANFWNGKSRNTLSCSWDKNTTGYYDDTYTTAKGHITAWISDAAASGSTGRSAGLSTAIDALKGTGLDIAIKPASIQTTPWVPVVIQVQNETGYEYTLTYTDGELDKQPNIIIEKSGDTYKYHIPRPWPAGDEQVEGERADINYVIKATLQVGEGNNQCGSTTELPSATATITLKDEDNDKCQLLEP